MSYSILQLQEDVQALLHGTTLSRVQNFYGSVNRAATDILQDLDPWETKETASLGQVYSGVFDYAAPTRLKSDKIIDVRKTVDRPINDINEPVYSRPFDLKKGLIQRIFEVHNNGTQRYLRISLPILGQTLVNSCDTTTANGTWAASGDASGLVTDGINFVQGTGSLRFNLAALGSSGILTNSTLQSMDLSSMEDTGAMFASVFLPDASDFTSVSLRWGSGAGDYWERTVTAPHFGSFVDGWNQCRFDWDGATEVGAPDATAVTYLRVAYAYNGDAQTNARLDYVFAAQGQEYSCDYYSKYFFRDSLGEIKERADDPEDVICLDTDAYDVYVYRVMYLLAQQIQNASQTSDVAFYLNEYTQRRDRYRLANKAENQALISTYYQPVRGGYSNATRYLNR